MPRSSPRQRPSGDLEELRIRAGFSQRTLALAAGVHPTTVLMAERGRVPAPMTQKRLAAALSIGLNRQIGALDLWPLIEDRNGAAA